MENRARSVSVLSGVMKSGVFFFSYVGLCRGLAVSLKLYQELQFSKWSDANEHYEC